jgi:hypothetical protein
LTATLQPLLAARPLDQNSSHGLGRGEVKMASMIPLLAIVRPYQSQIDFVNEGRGTKRLPRCLLCHVPLSDSLQVVIHQRQKLARSLGVAAIYGSKYATNVIHDPHDICPKLSWQTDDDTS